MKDTSSGSHVVRQYLLALVLFLKFDEIKRIIHVGLTIDAHDVSVGTYSYTFLLVVVVVVIFVGFVVAVLTTRRFVAFRGLFFALRPRNVLRGVPLYNNTLQVSRRAFKDRTRADFVSEDDETYFTNTSGDGIKTFW